jgi:hypothetical protein
LFGKGIPQVNPKPLLNDGQREADLAEVIAQQDKIRL